MTAGFSRVESGYLLSSSSGASAYGEPTWRPINGAWRGRIDVGCTGYDYGHLHLEVQYRPSIATEPTVVYLVRGEIMARVDINGRHKGRRYSHMQFKWSSQAPEEPAVAVPEWFVNVPLGPTVTDDLLERSFQDAARMLNVDTSAVEWTAPPERSPR